MKTASVEKMKKASASVSYSVLNSKKEKAKAKATATAGHVIVSLASGPFARVAGLTKQTEHYEGGKRAGPYLEATDVSNSQTDNTHLSYYSLFPFPLHTSTHLTETWFGEEECY